MGSAFTQAQKYRQAGKEAKEIDELLNKLA